LRRQFPGAQVQTKVEGKRGRDVLKGRFRRVRIEMANFQLAAAPLGSPHKSKKQGKIGRFELALSNFSLSMMGTQVPVQSMEMNFNDVVYDWGVLRKHSQVRLISAGPADAKLALSAPALQPVLQAKFKEVQNLKLSFGANNRVRVTGTRAAPLVGTPIGFVLNGRIEARNGDQLWLADPAVEMGGIPLAATLASPLIGNLNPLYAFDPEKKSPLRVQITSLQTRGDVAHLTANLLFRPTP
jgi:hypothetical protein